MARPKGSKNKVQEEQDDKAELVFEALGQTDKKIMSDLEEPYYVESHVEKAFFSYMHGNDPVVIGRAWEKFNKHLLKYE